MDTHLRTTPRSLAVPALLLVAAVTVSSAASEITFYTPAPAQVPVDSPTANGSGDFAEYVPSFTLKDAAGVEHNSQSLYKDSGTLLMITVPNLTQYEKQKRWEKVLKQERVPAENAPRCVVLEDLSQQKSYKDRVRKMMGERAKEDASVLFLIDEDGEVRRQFCVNNDETVILVIDAEGRIIHHESDGIEPTRQAARRVVREVKHLAERRSGLAIAKAKPMIVANKTVVAQNQ